MRSTILCGLFIVLICSITVRLSKATSAENDYDDDTEYNYDDYDEYDNNSPTPRIADYEVATEIERFDIIENKTIAQGAIGEENVSINGEENVSINEEKHDNKTESVQNVLTVEMNEDADNHDVPNCPKLCICKEQFQFIDCSNQSLSDIPKNLPNSSLQIDLSNNNIEEIQVDAFSNLTNLREIILTNNKIQSIDRNVFRTLDRLDSIELSSNRLSNIDPDTFLYTQSLYQLNLSDNPIVFEANKSFLNLPNLEVLNLVACNITELFDENFANLTGLSSLNLANNSFTKGMSVKAFISIHSLLKLKIPHISEEATYTLCQNLTVIDVISFDKYNISCFELISGSTFDESTITHAPPTTARVEVTTLPMRPTRMQQNATTETIVVTPTETAKPNLTVTESYHKSSEIENTSTTPVNSSNSDTGPELKEIDKSSQSIKTILIASIVVAIVGLMIGLICRKDIFGVKTKLCRTQRPEPATIPEQVPLNKV